MNDASGTLTTFEVLAIIKATDTRTLQRLIANGSFPECLNPTSKRRVWSRALVESWARGEYRPASVTTSAGT